MEIEQNLERFSERVGCEIWKNITGYEGVYQISNMGRVKCLRSWDVNLRDYIDKETMLNPTDNGKGYLIIGLRKDKERKSHYIHRLVAQAFIDNPNNYGYVNHIDYNKKNNAVSNLEWCTQKNNVMHSAERMRHPKAYSTGKLGEKCITKRKGRYRVIVNRKEYPSCATLEDAIKERDMILRGETA